MDYNQVIALLKDNKNELGIEKWGERRARPDKLQSFGIGLTMLRKLAKQIGKDHELALQLFKSDVYDAKIVAILIDDPKQITEAQVEMQVEHLNQGHLAHVFSSCGAPLAKTPFVADLAVQWTNSKDKIRRSCGYGLLYEISKSTKKSAPNDTFFLDRIEHIRTSYPNENNLVLGSMGGALMGIGKRNAKLNTAALKVAKSIGPIEIEIEGSNCEPFNVVKHLTSDYVRQKLNL
jgi:3-methyladenine DNA glycosylase AlkD